MQDHESDEPPKFKVIDRRLFDSEGNIREGVEIEETPTAAAESADPTAVADPEIGTTPGDDAPVENSLAASRPPAGDPSPALAEPARPLKFSEEALMRFVEEQYLGGLLALGAMPEPQTGQIVEDLDLAHVRIEVLGMLQERAGDDLPPEAKKGLDDVMYQLRMAYLQKSKVAKL